MRYHPRLRRRIWLSVAVLLVPAGAALAQGWPSQIIHGCITATGNPVERAVISVTRAPDRHVERAASSASGCYSIRIAPASGDYLVSVSAIGYRPFRTRVTTAADTALTVDVQLSKLPALSAVHVVAQRPVLSRSTLAQIDPGAGEVIADGVTSALTPDQQGDLAAIAGTVPGILNTPNGAATFGLGPDQNSTTLNGMEFSGTTLPRDARVETHVATSTFDPSRGGFGGAQVATELRPGAIWTNAQADIALDAPFAQASAGGAPGAENGFTSIVGSVGSTGELVPDRFTYNVAADVSQRLASRWTLENGNRAALAASGVQPDSALRLVDALRSVGIPVATSRPGVTEQSSDVTLIGRLDPSPWKHRSWSVTGYARIHRDLGVGADPASTRGQLGHDNNSLASVQAERSAYFHGTTGLNVTKTALTLGHQSASPNSSLPQGIVLVPSGDSAAARAFGYAAFGGNGGFGSDARNWSWESKHETSWIPHSGHHAVKLSLGARLDGFSRQASGNQFGRFSYTSIAEVAANRPASFSRSFGMSRSSANEWTGYASLGDHWYASRSLQFLYGLRIDGNHYLSVPAANPDVVRSFGTRTDHAPNTAGLSPRFGFTWIYSRAGTLSGTRSEIPGATFISGASGAIRGGVGLFRDALPVTLIDRAMQSQGLSSTNTVSCVGAAVPMPDWAAYATGLAAVPSACAGPPDHRSGLSQSGQTVSLFDSRYSAPKSWRASLEWLPQFPWFALSAQATYSLNLSQPSVTDLNFNGVRQFHLAREGGRLVFVPASDIVPETGALTSVGSRLSDAFTNVMSNRSDARSVARQLILAVSPRSSTPDPFYVRASWALSDVRQLGSGFDNTTFGSPLDRAWSPGIFDVRHQIQLQLLYYYQPRAITFTLYGSATSGLPFTPIVDADINGDGLANDRAFIFNPSNVPDAVVGAGMNSLLHSRDRSAASCLSTQLGQPAGQNSCRGPWSQTVNMRIGFGNAIPGTHGRAWASLNISNAISGIDLLLHGVNHSRGWGLTSIPDPVLLRVTGFDETTLQYKYAVNPRFGSSSAAKVAYRNPFRITLDIKLDLAKPLQAQQLDRWLRPGRAGHKGPRLSASALALKYSSTVPDIYRLVLEQADSLLLTPDQVNALTLVDARYRSRVDSVWGAVGAYLASLPDRVDVTEALHRVDAATSQVWAMSRAESPTMRAILTPIQLQLVPYTVNLVVNTDRPLHGGLIF